MRAGTFSLLVGVLLLGSLGRPASISQAVYPDDPLILGTLSDQFGVGCPAEAPPSAFTFSYGLFGDPSGPPLALVFDAIIIGPSSEPQVFMADETTDPDFPAVAEALGEGAPAGTTFGYQVEMDCLATSIGPGVAIPLDLVGLPVRGLELTIPPLSIVESPEGTFTLVPSGNFTLAAIGSMADLVDTDGDGTPDVSDACPAEAGPPATDGCPDSDGDGTPDGEDACPAVGGPPHFDGCPDGDGDGLPDHQDSCPAEAGPPEAGGCPVVDADGDGVPDAEDACALVPGLPQFAGCPDDDGDGVPEPGDACPGQPGLPEFGGCPDVDGDGVPDADDACPLVSTGGYDADGDGCKDSFSGLIALLADSPLPDNTARTLTNKAEDARRLACDVGNGTGAIQKLEDFRSYVATHTPGRISPSTAMLLDAYASTLIREIEDGVIGC
jgi:hypothetical protein